MNNRAGAESGAFSNLAYITAFCMEYGVITVLVVGGDTAGGTIHTLEIYDPAAGRFESARGVLSVSRSGHAMALLKSYLDSITCFHRLGTPS